MDANTALVLAALITAAPGIGALVVSVLNARRGRERDAVLAKLEVNTNSNTETIRTLASINGIRTGQDEERANPTLPGTPSPKLPDELSKG